MPLPSSQGDSAWGTPDTTGVRRVARDFSCSSKPHTVGLKTGPMNNSEAPEKQPVRFSTWTWHSLKAQRNREASPSEN